MPGATAPEPPDCDPYFSDNFVHHIKYRAYPILFIKTYALGSNHPMGWYAVTISAILLKWALFLCVGYCS